MFILNIFFFFLAFCLVSVLVVSFAVGDSYDKPPLADCKYFKDRVDKYLVADCTDLKLSSIPEIKTKDVEVCWKKKI